MIIASDGGSPNPRLKEVSDGQLAVTLLHPAMSGRSLLPGVTRFLDILLPSIFTPSLPKSRS